MFEKIRKVGRTKNITAMVVFGAICLVFIFLGVAPHQPGLMTGGAAATVNGAVISLMDYNQRVQQTQRQLQAQLDAFPQARRQEMEKYVHRRALEDLIGLEVIYQAANREGVKIADDEVLHEIIEVPAFQDQGRFKRERYDQYLEMARMSSRNFEDQLRKEMVVQKTQKIFAEALKASPFEAEKDQELKNTKLNVAFVSFDQGELEQKITLSAGDTAQFLSLKENVEALKKEYDAKKAQFLIPEEVRARHILLKVDAAHSESSVLKEIQRIAEEAKTQNFADLARKYSQDVASTQNGGDLGFFSKGRMVKEFDDKAFSLPVGQVSPPVKTEFGYHLIKVEEKKPSHQQSFEEVKEKLASASLRKQKVAGVIKKLEELAKGKAEAALNAEFKILGLRWQETGEVSLNQNTWPGLGQADRVAERVLSQGARVGLIPEMIQDQGRYYFAQLKSLKTAPAQPVTKEDIQRSTLEAANDAFESWFRNQEKTQTIVRNAQLLN